MKKAIIVTLVLLCWASGVRAELPDSVLSEFSYIPEIHGAFRGRWEMETESGYSHFNVRNARVSIQGKVAPIVSYLFNADFCDRGKFSMLDAYATVGPVKGFDFKVGQYRMPFGYESFRGPGGYFFNNRSYIGRNVNNYRGVGVSVVYTLPKAPLSIEAGVFNPTTIDDHTAWVKTYAYSGRALYTPGDWVMAAGMESIEPDSVRINLYSATVGYNFGRVYVEGEYMARLYTNKTHKATHAYNAFATYKIPLRKGLFDSLSFQARFDGTTALASGTREKDHSLQTTFGGRRRLTIGGTLDYRYKKLRAAVRLNFEKVWFDKGVAHDMDENDVLSAELIIKF